MPVFGVPEPHTKPHTNPTPTAEPHTQKAAKGSDRVQQAKRQKASKYAAIDDRLRKVTRTKNRQKAFRNHEVASSNLASSSKNAADFGLRRFQKAGVMEW